MGRERRSFGRLRRLPSGRYQAAYQAPDGQLHTAKATFGARDDAESWLSDRRKEIDRELWNPGAAKAANARGLLAVPVLGGIENMSGLRCAHCGEMVDVFSRVPPDRSLWAQGVTRLTAIPLDPALSRAGDSGRPIVVSQPFQERSCQARCQARSKACQAWVRARDRWFQAGCFSPAGRRGGVVFDELQLATCGVHEVIETSEHFHTISTCAPVPKSVPAIAIPCPPSAGPESGVTEKGRRCESSDVLPSGSVAVLAIRAPGSVGAGSVTSNSAAPEPSVAACAAVIEAVARECCA